MYYATIVRALRSVLSSDLSKCTSVRAWWNMALSMCAGLRTIGTDGGPISRSHSFAQANQWAAWGVSNLTTHFRGASWRSSPLFRCGDKPEGGRGRRRPNLWRQVCRSRWRRPDRGRRRRVDRQRRRWCDRNLGRPAGSRHRNASDRHIRRWVNWI